MRQVWKFPLTHDSTALRVSGTHRVLHFNTQGERPHVWIEVDPSETTQVEIVVRFFGTGHEIPPEFEDYIGTIMVAGGALVFHAYKSNKEREVSP